MDKKMDVVVSFDTTGSMYPCLTQVRREVEQFVNTMFTEFTQLRIGIIAHGDYCDVDNPYTIIYRELSRDSVGLCKFVRNVDKTYGGDADECYELVLNLAHSDKMGWREDADKILIMIGDASPHSPAYRDNKDNLDWLTEADELRKMGVKIFAVHALAGMRSSSKGFYKQIAEKTMGVYLTLDQFSDIVDLIKATVYQQSGEEKLSEFITIIKDSGKLTRSMDNNIKRLRGEDVPDDDYSSYAYARHGRTVTRTHRGSCDVTLKEMGALVPVVPGRFQVMTVDENCDIKGFVNKNGIEFKKGRGFYELTKAETVQQYKEIIMQDRETGEMFNGSQVREKLHLQPQSEKGGVNEKLHASDAKEFRIFVQSTSVNRKLIAGTTFLYEISDMEDTGTVISDTVKAEPKAKDAPKEKERVLPSVPESVAKEMLAEDKKKAKGKVKKSKKKADAEDSKADTKDEVTDAKYKAVDTKESATDTKESAETDKDYKESVEFRELPDMTEVVSVDSKEFTDILKGKSLEEVIAEEEKESAPEETSDTPKESPEAEEETVKPEEEHKGKTDEKKMNDFIDMLFMSGPCKLFNTEEEMTSAQEFKDELHACIERMFKIDTQRFGDKEVRYLKGDFELLKRLSAVAQCISKDK